MSSLARPTHDFCKNKFAAHRFIAAPSDSPQDYLSFALLLELFDSFLRSIWLVFSHSLLQVVELVKEDVKE